MKLLYLTEDYYLSKVHNNLLANMLNQTEDLKIYVFTPTRPRIGSDLSNSYYKNSRLIEIATPIDISLPLYRTLFSKKIECKIRLIEKSIPIKEIDFIIAATVFTEGFTAYELNKKYAIPYWISARGSDSDFYARYMCHLWKKSRRVISNSWGISYLTPVIKHNMTRKWFYHKIIEKLKSGPVINNGIDNIWLDNIYRNQKRIDGVINVVYIGQFFSNKNVLRLIKSISSLREKYDLRLTLIGGDGDEQKEIETEVSAHPNYLSYLGKIYDKEKLINIVRNSDVFAMVSHSETFGLVYAECLTQGLPILYSKNTGFDNMYPQGAVGYGVDSYSIESISRGLEDIILNYNRIKQNISILDFSRYSWQLIAKKYIDIILNVKDDKDESFNS